MVHAILLCCALFTDGGKPAETKPTAADRVAYEAARDKAGKNPAAHVQLALWCEAHGFPAERVKHLTLAASLDPSNVLARGLLGLVAFQGKWAKPEQVEQEIQNDPKFQALFREYLDRRVRTPQKADAQLHLADWCLQMGLEDEATAHYHFVTQPRSLPRHRLDSPGLQETQGPLVQARGPGCAQARRRTPEACRFAMEAAAREARAMRWKARSSRGD